MNNLRFQICTSKFDSTVVVIDFGKGKSKLRIMPIGDKLHECHATKTSQAFKKETAIIKRIEKT